MARCPDPSHCAMNGACCGGKKRETPTEEERLRYLTLAMQQLGRAVEWVGHAALDGRLGTPSMWLSRYIANAREAIAEAEVSLQLAEPPKPKRRGRAT